MTLGLSRVQQHYQEVFRQCAGSWDKVTPRVVGTMFERAERQGLKLKPFKKWLAKQPLPERTRTQLQDVYELF